MSTIERTVDLLFVGDVCLPPPAAEHSPLAALKASASPDTLLIANLEGTLTSCERPVAGRYAVFRDSPVAIAWFKYVDVALLANNHTGDFGVSGATEMIHHLQTAGVVSVGYGPLRADGTLVTRITRAGLRIAIVNACCPTTNPSAFATVESAGVAPLCAGLVAEAIRAAREEVDLVVFCPHWGPEMQVLPTPEQIAIARWAIDAGADAVVGHHAHVIQSIEIYRGAPVLYGLGNAWFPETGWNCSDQRGLVKSKSYEISERERLSLAVTLRACPAHARRWRFDVAAVRQLRFAASEPPSLHEVPAAVAAPGVTPLRRLLAHLLLRRLRHGGDLEYRAAMRNGRMCYWYRSLYGISGRVLLWENALMALLRKETGNE